MAVPEVQICSLQGELIFFSHEGINFMDAEAFCKRKGFEMVTEDDFRLLMANLFLTPDEIPNQFWGFKSTDGTFAFSFTAEDIVAEDMKTLLPGFMCVDDTNSRLCIPDIAAAGCLGSTEFFFPINKSDETNDCGVGSTLTSLRSISEYNIWAQTLEWFELNDFIFLTAMKLGSLIKIEGDILVGEIIFEDEFNDPNEEILSFLGDAGVEPWFDGVPIESDVSLSILLKKITGFVGFLTERQDFDITGPSCRVVRSDLCLRTAFDNESENALIFLVIAGGVAMVAVIISATFIRLLPKRKKKMNILGDTKKDEKQGNVDVQVVAEELVQDDDDDNFSIYTGITELQRRRSGGAFSLQSSASRRTQVTAFDRSKSQMVRSVISSPSAYTVMSQNLLKISPYIKNVRNREEVAKFVTKVSTAIEGMITEVDGEQEVDQSFAEFNAERVPSVEIGFYIQRLINGLDLWFNDDDVEGDETIGIRAFLLALHFLRKVQETNSLTRVNIHKLLCTSLLVSAKFIEDEIITNEFWADIAGIEIEEVTSLEQIFCFSLGFDFDVDEEEVSKSLETFSLK